MKQEDEEEKVAANHKKHAAPIEKKVPRTGKIPLYIGIMAEADKQFKKKLSDLFMESMSKMSQTFHEHSAMFKKMIETLSELMKYVGDDKHAIDGYKMRPTYHITSMFLGKEAWKAESELF